MIFFAMPWAELERANITPGFVEDALEALRSRDIDPKPLLFAADISPFVDGPVTNQQYGRLWWLIAEEIRCEFFGLGARAMRPGSFDLMCHAILHAGNLERALCRSLDFLNVILDEPHGTLRVADGSVIISLWSTEYRPAFAYRAYWLIILGVACWLIGRRIPLQRLSFACAAPPNRDDYRLFFGAPVMFQQPETTLAFDSAYLSLPLVRNQAALESFLRAAPGNLLIRYRHDEDMSTRVRARLESTLPADWPSFGEMAKLLGLSPASFRRRLRAEAQSLGTIKDELRFAAAKRLLSEGMAVADVAVELGYSEPSAFHRAFSKWSGSTPGDFRKNKLTS